MVKNRTFFLCKTEPEWSEKLLYGNWFQFSFNFYSTFDTFLHFFMKITLDIIRYLLLFHSNTPDYIFFKALSRYRKIFNRPSWRLDNEWACRARSNLRENREGKCFFLFQCVGVLKMREKDANDNNW